MLEDSDEDNDEDSDEDSDHDYAKPTKVQQLLHRLEGEALQNKSSQQMLFLSLVRQLCLKFASWQNKPITESTLIFQNIACFVDVFLLNDSSFFGVW